MVYRHKRSHHACAATGGNSMRVRICARFHPVKAARLCASRSCAPAHVFEIQLRLGACIDVAGPWMAQDIAGLEVGAIVGFLEHQVLGKGLRRVAHVQACQHHGRSGARALQDACAGCDFDRTGLGVEPEHASRAQLLGRQRIGGTRIAPAHVPEILGERDAVVLPLGLPGEHRFVEPGELAAHIDREIHVGGQLDGAVVGRLDAAAAGQHEGNQVLRPARVDHPQADGQHELAGLEGELQRAQISQSCPGLFLEIDPGDEELHLLTDVGLQRSRGARWNPISVAAAARSPDHRTVWR